jgi:hypothetical protein
MQFQKKVIEVLSLELREITRSHVAVDCGFWVLGADIANRIRF